MSSLTYITASGVVLFSSMYFDSIIKYAIRSLQSFGSTGLEGVVDVVPFAIPIVLLFFK